MPSSSGSLYYAPASSSIDTYVFILIDLIVLSCCQAYSLVCFSPLHTADVPVFRYHTLLLLKILPQMSPLCLWMHVRVCSYM